MDNNYHIFKHGELKKEDDSLRFDSADSETTYISIEQVEAIYAHGEVSYNTRLLTFLNQKQVEIHSFGWNGRYSGSYIPSRGQTSGKTVVNQAMAYSDTDKRLTIAEKIVQGSIHNMRSIVKYRDRTSKTNLQSITDGLNKGEKLIDKADTISELLGAEASARRHYYQLYREETPDEFKFSTREYNPPPDPVNALISYGNSLLYTQCTSAIRATSLDPAISFLHEPGERRCSLSLDVADLFKPVLVDRVLLRIMNNGKISPDGFETQISASTMSEDTRKTLLKSFEKTLEDTIEHPDLNRHISYQHLLRIEAYKLKRHLLTGEEYSPFKKWW